MYNSSVWCFFKILFENVLYILPCLELGDQTYVLQLAIYHKKSMSPHNASSIIVTIISYKNRYFKSDLRIPKIFFLINRLLGSGDMTDSMVNCSEKYDFNQLINNAWEDKFSDFCEIAMEIPGTT